MKNIVTINKVLLDLAIKFRVGQEIEDHEIKDMIEEEFENNITIDQHILIYKLVEDYSLEIDEYGNIDGVKPYQFIMSCLKEFRDELNKRLL